MDRGIIEVDKPKWRGIVKGGGVRREEEWSVAAGEDGVLVLEILVKKMLNLFIF